MPKKNRKSVEPVSLTVADAHFHPRDCEDYVDEVDEWRRGILARQAFVAINPDASPNC